MNIGKTIKKAVMGFLFLLIIISFAVVGMNQNLFNPGAGPVAVVNGEKVEQSEYISRFNQLRQDLEQQQGRPLTAEELAAQGLDLGLLNQLAQRKAIASVLERLGVHVSLERLGEEIRTVTAFFDPITGQFSRESYESVLAGVNLTPRAYESDLRESIAYNHMLSAAAAGLRPPVTMAAFQEMVSAQVRELEVAYITPAMVGDIAMPTDEQLNAYLQANAERIRLPELRVMTIARFSVADVLPTVTVDDAQVQALFEFRRDQASTPETRTLVQIPAKDMAQAQQIAARLSAGEDPNTVAAAFGASVVRLDNRPKTALPDRKMADAAFALAAGQTSAPIQGDLGLSVVKVMSVTPGVQPDLTDVRGQIEAEARQRAAEQKITEAADQFEDAREAGTAMNEAAEAAGAKVYVTPEVAANGANKEGVAVPGLSQRVLDEGFRMAAGEESGLINEAPGEYFVVRVEDIIAPRLPELEEVRAEATQVWLEEELVKRLNAKAEEMAAKMRGGESLAAVAAEAGARVQRVGGLSYQTAGEMQAAHGQQLLQKAFEAKTGEYFTGLAPPADGQTGAPIRGFVGTVVSVTDADINTVALAAQGVAGQFAEMVSQEVQEQILRAASGLSKVQTFPDRARLALGLDPAAPTAETAP